MKPVLPVLAAALALTACGKKEESAAAVVPVDQATATPSTPPVTSPAPQTAAVQLAPTQGNGVSGMLTLSSEGSAVTLAGTIQGLPPNGTFGFHIHENGDCSAPDASSAGEHFSPANRPHGDPTGENHHAGDMPNLKSDAQGRAQVQALVEGVTLGGGQPNDVGGRAVVVHQKADDYATQPSGDSGARIACGVIALPAM